jgi:uncharacterized YigZ family protein
MAEADYFTTIDKEALAEFKDKGSRFLAHAFPIQHTNDFKLQLQRLKKQHSKAVHFCFAYRLGTDGNQFRSSDDGEPSGTAGKPILGQIDSKGLTDVAIVVVRYFGGTLLGVPGLIQAYKAAASMALQLTPAIQKPIEVKYNLQFDYTKQNEVMTILKQFNTTIIHQEQQLFCLITVGIAKARLTEFLYRIKDLHTVEVHKA